MIYGHSRGVFWLQKPPGYAKHSYNDRERFRYALRNEHGIEADKVDGIVRDCEVIGRLVNATPAERYLAAFRGAGDVSPRDFATWMSINHEQLCFAVIDTIGSWPSSEPALRALQAIA